MLDRTAPYRLSVAALAASGALLTACQREQSVAPAPPAMAPVETPPAKPAPPPTLDRQGILEAIDAAASAYAAGQTPAEDALTGRRFVLRQAFGCGGPSPPAPEESAGDGLGRWSWGADRKTIEVDLTPGTWIASPLLAGRAEGWEAAEGFWLSRPWLRSEGCPAAVGDPLASGPVAPSPQTAGIAAVFEKEGSRLERRNGRAYSFVVRGTGEQPPSPAGGYRLVLEGRLTAFADGRAIRCRAASPDQRPVCVAAARLDRVAFEDAAGGVLSEWRPS